NDADPEVDHRPAGQYAPLDGLRDTCLDGRGVLLRNLARRCSILVDIAAAARSRLDHELDVAIVAARARGARTAGAHQLVLALAAPGDGLAVRDLGVADARLDPELAAHALDHDLE